MSAPVPRTTRTALSQTPGIPISGGNLFSYVRVVGNGNIPPVLHDWKLWLDLGLDVHSLVPKTIE